VLRPCFKRSAKRELFDLDDDEFVRVARVLLALLEDPRPRGYDKVAGQGRLLRVWAGRDLRVLYEHDPGEEKLVIVGIGRKDERTYR
jgi:mRNA-degrading endonuclease RelE of RelBE toxin-antitoxin system